MLFCQIFFGQFVFCQSVWFDVRKFGALGNGQANEAQNIQKAIDACAQAGGGKVYFPAGKYLTSTFFLKGNTSLFLENGAEILASRNPQDYTQSKGIYSTETDVPCLVMADKVENISIEGMGKFDGQAEHEWSDLKEVDNFIKWETENARSAGIEMKRVYAKDPKVCLFYITHCKNVKLKDIKITASPNWAVHLAHCEDVVVDGIGLYSSLEKGVNSDGLDIDGCRNVRIANCHIETGDDAICLKSTNKNGLYHACENITVTNCTLVSTSTALKIGTESHGDFRNIVFSNSVISNTNRGIGIFVRDGATVDGVIFSNLVIECKRKHFNWWGDGDPIRFVLLKRKPESRLGNIRNVLVSHVVARGQGSSLVSGFEGDAQTPARNLENIRFEQVQLDLEKEDLNDKRAMYVLQINNAADVHLTHCKLFFSKNQTEPKWQSGLAAKNIGLLSIQNCEVDGCEKNPSMWFDDVKVAELQSVQLREETDCYLKLEGKNTARIHIEMAIEEDNKPCIQFGNGVKKSALKWD